MSHAIRKYVYIIAILLFCNPVFSQDTIRVYYDSDSTKMALEYLVDTITKEKDGYFKIFDKKGEVSAISEYKKGRIWNIVLLKDSTGNVISDVGTLKNGNGTMKVYDDNSRVKNLVTYKNGLRNGLAIKYYHSSKKAMEGHYFNGKRCGSWYRFSNDEENKIVDTREAGTCS